MLPLDQDLQKPKDNLEDFADITRRILNHLSNVLSDHKVKNNYSIYNSVIADNVKYLRPINKDLILFTEREFDEHFLDSNELVLSVKTTSKDRMGKMFMDKILLENFLGHSQKVIGIFQNDVQRKGKDSISYTLVSGSFMVYSRFLTELDGVYYLDSPPNAYKAAYKHNMYSFSKFLLHDLWNFLSS